VIIMLRGDKSREPSKFERFDVFQRPLNENRIQTVEGGILSLLAMAVISLLVISEFSIYLSAPLNPELYVDTSMGEKLELNIDVILHHLPCGFISVNALDKTGNHQLDIHHDLYTTRIDKFGNKIGEAKAEKEEVGRDDQSIDFDIKNPFKSECGSCYGAETDTRKCCDTCAEVQAAYNAKGWAFNDPHRVIQCVQEGFMDNLQSQKDEGCRVHGYLHLNRVAGNVNIVPGKLILQNSRYVVDSELYQLDNIFNLTHTIVHVSFGDEYPGMLNPLDSVKKIWNDKDSSAMYQYSLQIVPTVYKSTFGFTTNTNQYAVTENVQRVDFTGAGVPPGLFFVYELSPIIVEYSASSQSFFHFLTNLCAIIGGVYTVASWIDLLLYKTSKLRKDY